jgi:hypothetical protein
MHAGVVHLRHRSARSAPALAQSKQESLRLHAANYFEDQGECGGGTNAVDIRVAPNPTGSIQIGIFRIECRGHR